MSEAANVPASDQQPEHPPMPLLFRDVVGWYAIATLAVGRDTGMLDAVIAGPVTASGLASACKVDARNAEAWLAAMTAHGYVTHDNGTFTMPPFEVAAFKGEVVPFDFGAIIDCCHRLPAAMPAVAAAMRSGRGIAPSVYHRALGDAVGRVNVPLYRSLLGAWLVQAGVDADLRRGVEVADIGCGLGTALLDLAGQYPASKFTGYDVNADAVQQAAAEGRQRKLANVAFRVADASAVSDSCDLVLVLDAFHHFPHPDVFLKNVARILNPGGKLLLAETTATGNLDVDAASPFARIVFSTNVLLCLQEGLHDAGAGTGCVAGESHITGLLNANGFGSVTTCDTGMGYTIYVATR